MEQETDNNRYCPKAGQLWAGWLVAAAAWGLHLLVSYGLVELVCEKPAILETVRVEIILHGLTILFFLLALSGAALAWRINKRLRAQPRLPDPGRSEFMATSGILLSLFFAIVVLVQGLPNMVLPTCL